MSIWGEIRNDFQEEDRVHIDAWLTPDDNEDGRVIAVVHVNTGEVEYRDDRARTDEYAQEIIQETLLN